MGTAYTFLTSDNSRHLPKLIEVLKESNQIVGDSLLNLLARTGGRMNNGRNYTRGGYNNNTNNYNNHSAMANNSQRNSYPQQNQSYSNNSSRDYSNGNTVARKRDLSSDAHNENGRANGDGTRVKKFRWDDGPAPTNQPTQLMSRSPPRNNMAYGPYPPSNGSSNGSQPPKSVPSLPNGQHSSPPAKSANGAAAPGYPSDYNAMYNLQYYQAIAAAAATNGGAGWQAAAYPAWPAAANSAK